ncbi:MAG: 1-acyl-sn-glycerol-3-phosphate acyltransferase [Oscillatoriales cyanobacterium RM1_1_9]|nr:1-acyl-sn-glycerol-3-phosphate acyltransferase [Oscillatoriales cyanobacterium SM2_3_0]NJO45294.1 1-acyl-sn-glycerol-3-phosphate acyltransferase [Oscillatoriales cyanobacterium RM2_1_1]NJO71545.1 1-acyl-sn-glycerol-3-phosphate acyltransferase [Oscillatoriales cyanobacterium RM1_1_9]
MSPQSGFSGHPENSQDLPNPIPDFTDGFGEELSEGLDEESLTPEMIRRAQEGVSAARDRAVQYSIQLALQRITDLTSESSPGASGEFRRQVMWTLIHSLFRVRVEYPERLPKTSAILAANHLNHIDPFILLSEIPAQPYCHILGDARTLYNQGWKRKLLNWSGGVIPVERWWKEELAVIAGAQAGREDLASLAAAIQQSVPSGSNMQTLRRIDRAVQTILTEGDRIILFPEGRLGTQEARLHLPFKRGTAIYALRTGAPIVPIALIGTRDLYLGKLITVRFGEPIPVPQVSRPKRQQINAVLQQLETALIDLLPPAYEEPKDFKLLRRFLNQMLC